MKFEEEFERRGVTAQAVLEIPGITPGVVRSRIFLAFQGWKQRPPVQLRTKRRILHVRE
jgi:hypothetical protein